MLVVRRKRPASASVWTKQQLLLGHPFRAVRIQNRVYGEGERYGVGYLWMAPASLFGLTAIRWAGALTPSLPLDPSTKGCTLLYTGLWRPGLFCKSRQGAPGPPFSCSQELLTADLSALTREAEEEEAAEAQTRGAVVAAAEAAAALAEGECEGEDGRSNPLVTTLTEEEEDLSENEGSARRKGGGRHKDRASAGGGSISGSSSSSSKHKQQHHEKERQDHPCRQAAYSTHSSGNSRLESGADQQGSGDRECGEADRAGEDSNRRRARVLGVAVGPSSRGTNEEGGAEAQSRSEGSSSLSFWCNPIASLTTKESRSGEDKDLSAAAEALHCRRVCTLEGPGWSPAAGSSSSSREAGSKGVGEEEEMQDLNWKNSGGSKTRVNAEDQEESPRGKTTRPSPASSSWSSSFSSSGTRKRTTDAGEERDVDAPAPVTELGGGMRESSLDRGGGGVCC